MKINMEIYAQKGAEKYARDLGITEERLQERIDEEKQWEFKFHMKNYVHDIDFVELKEIGICKYGKKYHIDNRIMKLQLPNYKSYKKNRTGSTPKSSFFEARFEEIKKKLMMVLVFIKFQNFI
ncbi:MAG: hypothetical protein LBT02_03680, partial [Rickettsiales bacterium]|nr:hypothetical protein [Rickettsiales bacterium]